MHNFHKYNKQNQINKLRKLNLRFNINKLLKYYLNFFELCIKLIIKNKNIIDKILSKNYLQLFYLKKLKIL